MVGKLLEQAEEVLAKEIYKRDVPANPLCSKFLQQVISAITALSSGMPSRSAFERC